MADKRRRRATASLHILQPDAAGADVGAEEIFVAVPPDRDDEPVRRFPTFTRDLNCLADWLQQCGIQTIAMESTSVYWIPLHQIVLRSAPRGIDRSVKRGYRWAGLLSFEKRLNSVPTRS